MGGTDPGSAREEAERLVATVLAAARLAAASGQGAARAAGLGPLGEMISGVFGHNDRTARPEQPRPEAATTSGPAPSDPASGPAPSDPPTGPVPSDPAGGPAASGPVTGGGTGGFATGGAECCVCPVCRGIAALRDPSPEFAERLATGAGEVAAGVAKLLRAFGEATATTGPPASSGPAKPAGPPPAGPPPAGPAPARGTAQDDEVWREATRTGHDSVPAPERDVWAAATHADARVRPGGATPPADVAGPAGNSDPTPYRSANKAAGTTNAETVERPAAPASRAPEEPGARDADPPGDGN